MLSLKIHAVNWELQQNIICCTITTWKYPLLPSTLVSARGIWSIWNGSCLSLRSKEREFSCPAYTLHPSQVVVFGVSYAQTSQIGSCWSQRSQQWEHQHTFKGLIEAMPRWVRPVCVNTVKPLFQPKVW